MQSAEPHHFFEILLPRPRNPRHPPCQPADYHEIVTHWRKTFAKKLFTKTGEWIIAGFDWHVFTYGYAEATSGKLAVDLYHQSRQGSGFIFTHPDKGNTPCCLVHKLPSHSEITHALTLFPKLADIYILDQKLRWTFVVTHEESSGLGPFFALPQ